MRRRLKFIYIFSLVILLVLVAFTWFSLRTTTRYSEIQHEQLVRTEDGWTIQFDIINREGRDTSYIITISPEEAGEPYAKGWKIPDGDFLTYVHYFRSDMVKTGKLNVIISKEGESIPFEQITYYLR